MTGKTDAEVSYFQDGQIVKISEHPGYFGVFTRSHYKGALQNGTRVVKVAEDKSGDTTPLGTRGTVLGSVGDPIIGPAYFIEWDDKPRMALFCVAKKLAAVQ